MHHGSDELNTSACSLVQTLPKFACTEDGINTFMIPTSRVHDGELNSLLSLLIFVSYCIIIGICDCCDGRDEANGPYAFRCANINTCGDRLVILRKEALISYRNIQSGLRAKSNLLSTWRTKKAQDSRSLQSLREERVALIKYRFDLRYLLSYKESTPESNTRWELIREREHDCAMGNVDSCDYFHRGYLTNDELNPATYKSTASSDEEDDSTSTQPTPLTQKKRFIYEYTAQEIDYFRHGKGLDRVRATICPVKDVLPDDNARTTFVKLGEYYDYMLTQAEKNKKLVKNPKQIPLRKLRKYHTLFGRYLEFGDVGYRTAAVTFFEVLGLVFSPVSLSYHGLAWMTEELKRFAWESLEYCADNLPEASHDSNSTDTYSTVMQSIKVGCDKILEAEVEGSAMFNLLQNFDPLRYSPIIQTLDYFFDTFETFFWSLEIMQRAPFLYFEWYINQKYQVLPPRRQACLLREALTVLESEMSVLEEKIAKEEEILELQSKGVEEQLQFKHSKASVKNNKDNNKSSKVLLDYAPDGSWESLSQLCSSLLDGEYNYTLCLFDEAKQQPTSSKTSTATSLGVFSHWGSEDLQLQHLPHVKEYLMQMEAAAQQRKASAAGGVTAVLHDLHGVYKSLVTELPKTVLTSLTTASGSSNQDSSAGQNDEESIKQQLETQLRYYYTTQLYEHGQRCPVGQNKQRSTLVSFVCGAEFKILSIHEPSVCAYEMKVSIPLACDVAQEEQAMSRMKSLGVFGF